MKQISDLVLMGTSNSDIAQQSKVYDLDVINNIRDKVIGGLRNNSSCKNRKVCKLDSRNAHERCGEQCNNFTKVKPYFLFQLGR